MPADPRVSILLNNHDYGQFLAQAIDSALAQTYANVEVVVVDDGSTDDSRAVMASYGDRIISILTENAGQASAFNAGVAASSGEILCFLDADDVFFPTKVSRVVDVFRQFPETVWVRHELEVTDENLRPLGAYYPDIRRSGPIPYEPHGALERKTRFLTSGMAVRRGTAAAIFPIPAERLSLWALSADGYVAFWCGLLGPGYSLDEPLTYYRRQLRHRVMSRADFVRSQQRQILLDEVFSEMWTKHRGVRRTSTMVFKHRLIIETLNGRHTWSPHRQRELACGLAEAAKFVLVDPRLAVRQATALLFAFGFPRRWVAKLIKTKWLESSAQQIWTGQLTEQTLGPGQAP
jgi:glycosyltransferase involved in cell wall biosynthesis